MSTHTFVYTKGQGHSLTFVQDHSDSTFLNFFSLETARPSETKFHVAPLWDWIMKVSTSGLCHMTKMALDDLYLFYSKVKFGPCCLNA